IDNGNQDINDITIENGNQGINTITIDNDNQGINTITIDNVNQDIDTIAINNGDQDINIITIDNGNQDINNHKIKHHLHRLCEKRGDIKKISSACNVFHLEISSRGVDTYVEELLWTSKIKSSATAIVPS
ncbi:hypothetical protein AVEN_140447-1, partial [Araneus ventricosus]